MKVFSKMNKKILIGLIISIIFIIAIVTILLNNKKVEQKVEVLLKENLNFEMNSEVNLLSLVSEENKAEIISEDEMIDTSTLGEKEIVIKYKDKEEKEYRFKINIIDTQTPTIEYQKELSTTVGTKIDLLKNVKASDNSKEEIKATIEGEYSFDKEGTYHLKYVAVDSSNNKKEEEFTLVVNKKDIKSTTTNNSPTSNNITKNNNSNNNSQTDCDEYLKLYPSNMVYTSVPNNSPNLSWNSAKFYITKEVKEDGGETYSLHNEKISGHSIGKVAADSIMAIVGDLTEMKYTEDNPIILYQLGVCYNN